MGAITVIGDATPVLVIGDASGIFTSMSYRPSTSERHIYAGDSPTFNFQIKDSGVAKNLTGLTIGFCAKVAPVPSSTFLFNVQATVTDAAKGLASATLTSSQTQPAGEYTAEVSQWSGGSKLTLIQFPLVIDNSANV